MLNDSSAGYLQIQDYLTANSISAADINVVSASSSLNGVFTPRVAFVDPNVADYQTLIADMPANATIVVLDADRDGVQQIHDYLANNTGLVGAIDIISNIASLDVLSHGTAGEITLGSTALNSDTLASYSAQLADIGSHLTGAGDIMLYGCDVAAGAIGQNFIDQLASATGADVAASTDLTGSTDLGGDWVLEANTGTIETVALADLAYEGTFVGIGAPGGVSTWNNALSVSEQGPETIIDGDVAITGWSRSAGNSVTVSVASPHSGDQLSIKSTAGKNQISVSGTTVYYTDNSGVSGTTTAIGTIDSSLNGFNGHDLKINLNNVTAVNATSIQLLARALQFNNTSDAPPIGSRSITLTLDDSTAGVVFSNSASVTITAVNDAPTTSAVTLAAIAEDSGARTITQAELLVNASDAEGDTLTASDLAIASGNGSLTDNKNGTWSYTPALNDDTAVSFSYTITDNGKTNGVSDPKPVTGSATLDITPVNDAPMATNLSAAEIYTEDTALNLTDIVISDVDSANVTAILTLSSVAAGSLSTGTSGAVTSTYNAVTGVWTASGAKADVNALLTGVTFNPASNFNGNFTVSTSVSDGEATVTGNKTFTGAAVNDAPITSLISLSTVENSSILIPVIPDYAYDVDTGDSLLVSNAGSVTLNWAADSTSTTLINPVTKVAVPLSSLTASISISADGKSVSVTPSAEFDWMTSGQKVNATFNYTVKDLAGSTDASPVTIAIVGSTSDKGKTLSGTNGNDTLTGTTSEDVLQGGNGNDTLAGNDKTDALYGGNGDDILSGDAGIDYLYGDSGNDKLDGGADNDVLFGGKGNDILTGGSGADHFVFEQQLGADRIMDFHSSEGDKLDFVDLFTAPITASQFVTKYVTDTGNDLLISLPGGSVTLVGVADTSGLDGAISFVIPS